MSQATTNPLPSTRKEVTGLNRITQKALRDICKRDKLYQTPRLNDVLYLHYQGYQYIECLEEYTELKCLWLECNAISEIQGLEQQTKLKCLFLQNNLIQNIDNLGFCKELDTLNLSNNHIRKIQNVGSDILPVLNTLNLASNYLKDSESLADLVFCKTVSVLDLSNNRIDDILVVKIFEQMPNLRVLVLQGNPVVSRLPQYRKTLILACKELTYLDSRPVFPRDRACAEAWKQDGYEGERKENNRWNRAERKKIRDSVNATIRLRNRHRPADQQDALLSSTDSEAEEETNARAQEGQIRAALTNSCQDDIWNEVDVDNKENQPSAEDETVLNSSSTGSSTSFNNETDGSQADLIAEQSSNRNMIPCDTVNTDVLAVAEKGDMQNIKELFNKEIIVDEKAQSPTRILIEEGKLEEENMKESKLSEEQPHITEDESKIQPPNLMPELDSSSDMSDSGELENTYHALENLTQNNKPDAEPTIEQIKSKQIEQMYKGYAKELSVNHPNPLELLLRDSSTDCELEARVCCEEAHTSRDSELEDVDSTLSLIKTQEEIAYEKKSAEANEKVERDMEALENQMETELEELKQLQSIGNERALVDETDSEAKEEENLSMHIDSLEISKDATAQMKEKQRLVRTLPTPDIDMPDNVELIFAKLLDDVTDNVPTRVFGGSLDTPSTSWHQEELLRQLTLKEMEDLVDIPDNTPGIIVTNEEGKKIKPLISMSSEEAADAIIKQKSLAINSDEAELRKMLQELEAENEMLYQVNTAFEDTLKAIKSNTGKTELSSSDVCISLLNDLIDELQYNEIIATEKPKSYDFGLIESDEEFSYSTEPKVEKFVPLDLEDPAKGKSIRECLDVFGDFITAVNDRKQPTLLGKKATTAARKVEAAENLLKSEHLTEFNNDTAESLDAQLEKQQKKLKRHAAQLASRCYAQREKYDDSLELVDNKLMVVKKDTGEFEDVRPPPALISDSEESEEDDSEVDEPSVTSIASTRGLWTKPFQPKPRKSAEHIVLAALQRHERMQSKLTSGELKEEESSSNEEKDDEQGEDIFNYPPKTVNTFNGLDQEFFEKLDFGKVPENESEVAAVCMRSYNELKACMKAGSQEIELTSEENAILQEMLPKDNDADLPTTNEEAFIEGQNDLFKKMVQRTKEQIEFEMQSSALDPEVMEDNMWNTINLSMGGCRLFERKSKVPMPILIDDVPPSTSNSAVQTDATDELSATANAQATTSQESTEQFNKKPDAILSHESTRQFNQKPEGQPSEEPEVVQEENPKAEMTQNKPKNDVDDDIISDSSTDYESEEEIPVIEPPKLPVGALKSIFFSEMATELAALQNREKNSLEIYKLSHVEKTIDHDTITQLQEAVVRVDIDEQKSKKEKEVSIIVSNPQASAAEEKETEIIAEEQGAETGAIHELRSNASLKWDKIAKQLSLLINENEMKLLESQDFCEDNEDNDELAKDLNTLQQVDQYADDNEEDSLDESSEYFSLEADVNRNPEMELKNDAMDGNETDKENADFESLTDYQNSEEVSKDSKMQVDNVAAQLSLLNDQLEIETKDLKSQHEINQEGQQKCTADISELTNDPITSKVKTDLLKFDAIEPSSCDIVENTNLTTADVECNLEVLGDDGSVIKKTTVNAKVTYDS